MIADNPAAALRSVPRGDVVAAQPFETSGLCDRDAAAVLAQAQAQRCAALGPAFLVFPLSVLLLLFAVLS